MSHFQHSLSTIHHAAHQLLTFFRTGSSKLLRHHVSQHSFNRAIRKLDFFPFYHILKKMILNLDVLCLFMEDRVFRQCNASLIVYTDFCGTLCSWVLVQPYNLSLQILPALLQSIYDDLTPSDPLLYSCVLRCPGNSAAPPCPSFERSCLSIPRYSFFPCDCSQ